MANRVRCPICQADCSWQGNPSRPFCSERCRFIDLSNWLGERYRIPANADDEPEGAATSEDDGDS